MVLSLTPITLAASFAVMHIPLKTVLRQIWGLPGLR